jgi:hypothetical protein
MYPCSTCDRHLRESDRLCPFCGTVQSTVVSPCFGTLALTVALLGSTACARDSGSEGSTAGTTTSMTSMTTMTSTESGESSETDTETSTTVGDGDGDGDTTNDTNNTSGSFYAGPSPVNDFWGISECDSFEQDCPEGEKCVPYASTGETLDANKCLPITGEGEPGDVCTYGGIVVPTDDCGADSHCWADGDVGVCREFCQGTPDEPTCPEGFQCLIGGDGSISLCMPTCDPLLQDCDPGSACYWNDVMFTCEETTGNVALGDPCVAIGDCSLGLICASASLLPNCAGDYCCVSYCDLSAPMCEQPDTECAAFFDGVPPAGYEDVGVCIIP